ncbi:MAG: hypothetical protein NC089_02915 [Bacteroides sp.]|nr:hypothetical protein [Bacteroides sp.]MCM1550526.1 hypothetical protein [Clostridium sp.]
MNANFFGKRETVDYRKMDECRVTNPDSVQDLIEIYAVAEDGIFEVKPGLYSKTYWFANINYDILGDEEQMSVLVRYMKLLQGMNVRYKISYLNDEVDMEEFKENVLLAYRDDAYDSLRKELNAIIQKRIMEGKQGMERNEYFTLSVRRNSYEEAKNYFISLEASLQKSLHKLGSYLVPLNCESRFKLLYDIYHSGDEDKLPFRFDYDAMIESARDFLNDLAPARVHFDEDSFELGRRMHCRALYVKNLPTELTDRFIQKLLDLPYRMIISVDVEPMDRTESKKLIEMKYLTVQNKIRKQQKIRNRNQDFSSDISLSVQDERDDVQAVREDIEKRNMSISFVGVTILVFAPDKEILDERTRSLKDVANEEAVTLDIMWYRQREGLNTSLPIGIRQAQKMRTMTSGALTVFIPFTTQELCISQGTYYGINQLSKNAVFGDRRTLKNGNAWIFGVPGSGKSLDWKLEMLFHFLQHQEDEIIIFDPNNECEEIAAALNGTYIDVRPGSDTYINGFDFPQDMKPEEIVASKVSWLMSVHVRCRQDKLTALDKSIIDQALRNTYAPWVTGKKSPECPPTMVEYRQELLNMQNPLADDLALELAYFTEGSLNMFAKQTNVDIRNRLVIYGLRNISKDLQPVAITTIMESLRERVFENFKKGKATMIYIDEAHRLTGDDVSAEYLDTLWREFRKFYGFCTGITHQAGDVCKSDKSRELVRNSAFLWLFGQDDIGPLKDLGFTDEQLQYVLDAEPGTGLLKHGKVIIPVDNQIPENTEIYRLLNTDPDKYAEKE